MSPPSASGTRLSIGVLADDLTGAMASASRLAIAGARPQVVWERGPGRPAGDAVVADMRTREGGGGARRHAREWADWLRGMGCRHYELRIDSLLRGSPAEELGGLVEGAGLEGAPVIALPAFPEAGRTTVGGVQRSEGAGGGPQRVGEVGPVLFGAAGFELVEVEVVVAGAEAICARLRGAIGRGSRNFVLDATREEHLRDAGLAIAAACDAEAPAITASPGSWLRFHPAAHAPDFVVVVVGSATATNERQLEQLLTRRGAEVERVAVSAAAAAAVADPGKRIFVVETLTAREGGANLAELAAATAAEVIERATAAGRSCAGAVASGGLTATHLIDRLGASSLARAKEVAPLCSEGTLVGGPFAGLPICAKGGEVGEMNTFERLVRQIEGVER